jgi:hypothetical protein
MAQGTIYILRNPAYRDSVIKIGKTKRGSDERAAELARVTGVPSPFEVLYQEDVVDVDLAEKLIHDRLKVARIRPNREFFQLPVRNAVRVVFDVCLQVNREQLKDAHRIALFMNGRVEAQRLKDIFSAYMGGDTRIVLCYQNQSGECQIMLPRSWSVRWNPRLVEELREVPGVGEILVVGQEGRRLRVPAIG